MTSKLTVVADNKIPFLQDFFAKKSDLLLFPGEEISHEALMNADILLTRTVTPVNSALLSGTTVQFLGTATSGTDHIDESWLSQQPIVLASAAGANSHAVAQYVMSCLTALENHGRLEERNPIVGVIGCGRIGSIVAEQFTATGYETICYDPFAQNPLFHFTSLEDVLKRADIITLHTPLTKTGLHPTYHLIDTKAAGLLKENMVLINTARGGVIDQNALLKNDKNITLCLDVWENEPAVSVELLQKVFIGTPHIAGYSLQAKYRATQMIYEKAAAFFGWAVEPAPPIHHHEIPVQMDYDPYQHTQDFRRQCQGLSQDAITEAFIQARKAYPLRIE